MNKKQKIVGLVFIILGMVGFVLMLEFVLLPEIYAGAGDNVSGWAWSENIGWISFNCDNPELPEPRCTNDYGVRIETDGSGVFSGIAWSRGATDDGGVGWITFNEADLTGCPEGTCRAWLDTITGEVRGWARALAPIGDPQAGDWDGWISLSCLNTDSCGASVDYGIQYVDLGATAELEGWAWGGDDDGNDSGVIGWTSFNRLNCDQNVNNGFVDVACGGDDATDSIVDYKVVLPSGLLVPVNIPPEVKDLVQTREAHCSTPHQHFSWVFEDTEDGFIQTSYWLQVKRQINPVWVIGDGEYDSDKTDDITIDILVPLDAGVGGEDELEYNTWYDWRVKVYDSEGADSGWVDGVSFKTAEHLYPLDDANFDFTIEPIDPTKDEVIQLCTVYEDIFIDPDTIIICPDNVATCYDLANNPIDCSGKIFNWTIPGKVVGDDYDFVGGTTANIPNPQIVLRKRNSYPVTLSITDNSITGGGTCSEVMDINIGFGLPNWREIAP